ncbi:MAG: hypothetical protein L6V78_04905 [Clostridium sp.]|nr:MAG: hypothetical protein L6V78_04905 [Clostridium sp.]
MEIKEGFLLIQKVLISHMICYCLISLMKKYKEFGISLNDMSKLSNETVEKINNKIVVEDADTERKKKIGLLFL